MNNTKVTITSNTLFSGVVSGTWTILCTICGEPLAEGYKEHEEEFHQSIEIV